MKRVDKEKHTCPKCGANLFVKKNGSFIAKKKSGEIHLVEENETCKQRYYCKDCERTFIDFATHQKVCGSKNIIKYGKFEIKLKYIKSPVRIQKYYCSNCKKSFAQASDASPIERKS